MTTSVFEEAQNQPLFADLCGLLLQAVDPNKKKQKIAGMAKNVSASIEAINAGKWVYTPGLTEEQTKIVTAMDDIIKAQNEVLMMLDKDPALIDVIKPEQLADIKKFCGEFVECTPLDNEVIAEFEEIKAGPSVAPKPEPDVDSVQASDTGI